MHKAHDKAKHHMDKAAHHHEKAAHHHEMAKKSMKGGIVKDKEMAMAKKGSKKGSKYP